VGSVCFIENIAFGGFVDDLTLPACQQANQKKIMPNTAILVHGRNVRRCKLVFLDLGRNEIIYGL
jgi:hypothetical protein